MRYIHDTLLHDERVVYESRPHWVVFLTPVVAFLVSLLLLVHGPDYFTSGFRILGFQFYHILALIAAVAGVYYALSAYIFYRFSEYGISNKRVLMKTGLIQRNSLEIFLDKIEAIHVDQTILGRILNYGGIVVIGTGGTKDYFRFVPDPIDFRKKIQQQIDYEEHQK